MSLPVASLGIRIEGERLQRIDLLPPQTSEQAPTHPVAAEVQRQIGCYLEDPAWRFDLPVQDGGTPFQQRVWQALREIRPGQPFTYGGLAAHLGSGPRAVGSACRANPIPVVVPCHRVIATTGLGGFAGSRNGLWPKVKEWLLSHEGYIA
ncbi:MAG: methylated-DNA--[protein]-cysteine S-methyltransferase [Chromatiales bacterium]|nr:methylated-DNA--[protein]-cysteine S-methyltransferase [Chromatiales bacterium]